MTRASCRSSLPVRATTIYAYINPDTKQATVVPSKHYKDILDQPVEVLVNDQVKKQFLNIMFKQMKTLKEEEPILFNETLLLMDLNKTPDSLELNEEAALKITATELVESEKTQKKKFHLVDNAYLDSYEATKNDSELMAQIFKEQQNDRVYSVELVPPTNAMFRSYGMGSSFVPECDLFILV